MTLDQIRCFLMVANCKSFSKASRQLFLSQSTISYQIKALEEELGFSLLTRTSNGVVPTETGRYLAAAFSKSVNEIDHAISAANNYQKSLSFFNIALGCSLPYATVGKLMDDLLRVYPTAQISLLPMNTENPVEPLLENKADVLFTYWNYVQNLGQVAFVPLFESELYCIMSQKRSVHYNGSVCLDDVASLPVFFPRDLDKYGTFKQLYLSMQKINPNITILHCTGTSVQEVFPLIADDVGIVFTHENNARIASHVSGLSILKLRDNVHSIGICWLKSTEREITQEFVNVCRKHYLQQTGAKSSAIQQSPLDSVK